MLILVIKPDFYFTSIIYLYILFYLYYIVFWRTNREIP